MILENMNGENLNSSLLDTSNLNEKKKRRIIAFQDSSEESSENNILDVKSNKENINNVSKLELDDDTSKEILSNNIKMKSVNDTKVKQRSQRREKIAESLISSSDSDSSNSSTSSKPRIKRKKKLLKKSPLKPNNSNMISTKNNEVKFSPKTIDNTKTLTTNDLNLTNNKEKIDTADGINLPNISDLNAKASEVNISNTDSKSIDNLEQVVLGTNSSIDVEINRKNPDFMKQNLLISLESDKSDIELNEKQNKEKMNSQNSVSSDDSEEYENVHRKRSSFLIESDQSDSDDKNLNYPTKTQTPSKRKSINPILSDYSSNSDSENEQNVRIFKTIRSDDSNSESETENKNLLKEKDSSSDSGSSSDSNRDSSSNEDGPPIRIFRNKDNIGSSEGVDHFEEEEGGFDEEDVVAISRHRRKNTLPPELEIKSETQRLIRESNLNLPYFVPEPKRLSDMMKRPVLSTQHNPPDITKDSKTSQDVKDTTKETTSEQMKTSPEKIEYSDIKSLPEQEITPVNPIKNKRLLLLGKLPSLSPSFSPKIQTIKNTEVIDLDDTTTKEQPAQNGVSGFIARFLKHSQTPTLSAKKKVKFNIIRKEKGSQGAIDLVSDVVVTEQTNNGQINSVGTQREKYEIVRKTLSERMKKRRAEERTKKEELRKLNNEEIGLDGEDLEEEFLEDEWSDNSDMEEGKQSDREEEAPECEDDKNQSDEEKMSDNEEVEESDGENGEDSLKSLRINKIIDDEDEESIPPPDLDVGLSNSSTISKASMLTSKSESLFPHHSSDGSLLLFDDSLKKSNQTKDDTFFESMIPLNQPDVSAISNSSKPNKFNCDDDSYFCSERSPNNSTSSQMKIDYESQFIDSDGFIKEPKLQKSMNSFLPPGAEDDNAIDCNMSQLLNLCSGNFPDSRVVDEKDENAFDESFGFKVEAGKTNLSNSNKFNFSDNEEEDDEDDEVITIVRKKATTKETRTTESPIVKENFVDEEAELSGDDNLSEDEFDDNEGNEYEEEVIDEVLPTDKVLLQQVNKVHLKKMLEDDQHEIELLQEAFADDFVENKRKRKFRWKNSDGGHDESVFMSDDDEDEGKEADLLAEELREQEESQWRMLRLEREEFLRKQSQDEDFDEDSNSMFMEFGKNAVQSRRNSDFYSELSKDSQRSMSLSNGFNKMASKSSFLNRKPEILSKFAQYKEVRQIKGSVNSSKMVFKAASPKKNSKKLIVKKPSKKLEPVSKKPRLDEDSNSVFNLFNS